MYKYIDLLRILAVGLAAALVISLSSHEKKDTVSVKNCLLFPQFTQAASSDRSIPADGEEIVFSFKILEIIEALWK